MMGGRLYVIGAGMAGLAAAVRAVGNGRDVTVMEAARHGGGRCRSFHDAGLDRVIDNGTHMILGANQKVFKFLDAVGAKDGLLPMGNGEFNFFDLASGDSWSLRPGKESIPWWLLLPSRRVPDTGLRDYLALRHLAGAGGGASLGDFFDPSRPIYERLWAPLSLAVLNNRPETASARLFWRVFEKTFFKGAKACQPFWAPAGLSAALIGPAMAFLLENGTEVRFSRLLKALLSAEERITQLNFAKDSIELAPEDSVILAVPPGQARSILGEAIEAFETRPIVNVHFRLDKAVDLPGGSGFLGVIGGASHWMFAKDDLLSVTISSAEDLAAQPASKIANIIWGEAATLLGMEPSPMPPYRVIKEHRATIAQTPDQIARRPDARTQWRNLFLAGDWTDTGLPATIEGAITSGFKAAELDQLSRD